ncbi:cytochrome b [Agrobacterium rosae]|uniref:cytochrome b n=1 Tax=Agrobacterium rosae TaxID=1972867 RepID=UPI0019D3FC55|nr:cytochrome b [Agrobacterium rosae]MBN7809290.1 cytochrome b [Agrobacterium rosae]
MWMDRPDRYGLVSRLLHWTMAYLLIWQFLVIVTWRLFGDRDWVTTVTSFGPGHGTVGLLVIGLVVIRAIWALVNRKRRPVQSQSVSGRAAVAVHVSFYVLMFTIPGLALLRAYGSGKGWQPWIPASGVEVSWMMTPANLLHGMLAWCLSILIGGHVIMALVHRFRWKGETLGRMTGRLDKSGATGERPLKLATPKPAPKQAPKQRRG